MPELYTLSTPPSQKSSLLSNPDLLTIGGVGILFLLLLIGQALSSDRNRHAKTAKARFATASEIANCARMARKMIAKPSSRSFSFYVTEPIGRYIPSPDNLGRYSVGRDISYFPKTNTSTLVVGGAGSGKTVNFINPAVISAIRQGASIVYYDYKFPDKDQSLPVIMEALKEGYQVRLLAPGQDISQCFNCLDFVPDDISSTKAAEVINIMALNYFKSKEKKDYFDRAGANIAAGGLLLAKWIAKVTGRPELANLLMVSQILNLDKLPLRLIENKSKLNPWTYKAFSGLTSIQTGKEINKQQVGVLGTAQEIFRSPTAVELIPALCGQSTLPLFDKEDPLKIDGKVLLVLGLDKGLQESVLPAFATILQQLLIYNLDAKRPRKTTLVVAVDEASTLIVPWFLKGINQERGSGFSGIFGAQYPGQLEDAYGASLSKGFEASCGTSIWFATGDSTTSQHLSKKLGEKEVIIDSKSKSKSVGKERGGSNSTSEQRYKVPLLEAQEIEQFPTGKAIIFSPGVGNGREIKIPYVHQFKYDESADNARSLQAQKVFEQLSQMLVSANPPKDSIYYSNLLDDYNSILEEWLPLPDDSKSATPPTSKISIKGQVLIDALNRFEKDFSGIDAERSYPIPQNLLTRDGKLPMSLENCLNILGIKDE